MVSYAERPWTKLYHARTPKTLNYPAIPLHQFLIDSAKRVPNSTALITSAHLPVFGRVASRFTYKQLEDSSDALAVALIDRGLKKGDRVVLLMPNTAAFVISFYAVLKAGGAVSAANPTYPADKLQYQVMTAARNS